MLYKKHQWIVYTCVAPFFFLELPFPTLELLFPSLMFSLFLFKVLFFVFSCIHEKSHESIYIKKIYYKLQSHETMVFDTWKASSSSSSHALTMSYRFMTPSLPLVASISVFLTYNQFPKLYAKLKLKFYKKYSNNWYSYIFMYYLKDQVGHKLGSPRQHAVIVWVGLHCNPYYFLQNREDQGRESNFA